MKQNGYWGVKPEIKKVSFPKRGKISVELKDGREIIMPISAFPSIKKIPVAKRKDWYLMGGGFTWDYCDDLIHLEQILGDFGKYWHESPVTE